MFYAREGGALVCDSPKPLADYKSVFKDVEARAKYLNSEEAVANCKLVTKNTVYEAAQPKAAFVTSTEVVRLHLRGDTRNAYALKGEWLVTSPEIAKLGQTVRSCIIPSGSLSPVLHQTWW